VPQVPACGFDVGTIANLDYPTMASTAVFRHLASPTPSRTNCLVAAMAERPAGLTCPHGYDTSKRWSDSHYIVVWRPGTKRCQAKDRLGSAS
jgi:hypothetical protein